ncbi:MAG: universal stress protein [Bacteroidia bacterium]|nr:universal stress protein [Bacteroidia bacterium]MCX7763727.1 universal stress protein [Bacteroidia bacterium]MDW8058362.1 universal stress protein [Bacteroidia bacterium]
MLITSAMSQTGGDFFRILAPIALDSTNEEEILLSLPYLVRGLRIPPYLRLYHVLSPDRIRLAPLRGESFLHQIEQAAQQAEEKLRTYVARLREKIPPPAEVSFHVEKQEVVGPAEEILAYMASEPYSLLILSFKQRKKWERFFGTTALWDLIEQSPVPVLLLSTPLTIPPRRILWITSMHSEGFPLLNTLIPLVRQIQGTLYCAKINTPSTFVTHRTFQRQVLDMCDYIIDHVDPDFVPEECLLYADKEMSEGVLHVVQDFLMDVVALDVEEALSEWKVVDKLIAQQLPVLFLRSGKGG